MRMRQTSSQAALLSSGEVEQKAALMQPMQNLLDASLESGPAYDVQDDWHATSMQHHSRPSEWQIMASGVQDDWKATSKQHLKGPPEWETMASGVQDDWKAS